MHNRTNVSKRQIEQARTLDLLSYLRQYEPQELVKVAPNVYSTRSHDSLKISNGKWFRWSTGDGGVSALDYLVKVRGMDFVRAVQTLCDRGGYMPEPQPNVQKCVPQKQFVLPKPYANNDRVLGYLMRRGISLSLLRFCINTGRLYEDERHNCCFVGFDAQGTPRYAMLRSSSAASTFLREAEGSDKRFSFSLTPQKEAERLYLFESAIDCLSFIELQRMDGADLKQGSYLSLSGVYQAGKAPEKTPLPASLTQFLSDNPHIRQISLCLDNDEAGRNAANAICAKLPEQYMTELLLPKRGKDYNEELMSRKKLVTDIQTRGSNTHFMEERER